MLVSVVCEQEEHGRRLLRSMGMGACDVTLGSVARGEYVLFNYGLYVLGGKIYNQSTNQEQGLEDIDPATAWKCMTAFVCESIAAVKTNHNHVTRRGEYCSVRMNANGEVSLIINGPRSCVHSRVTSQDDSVRPLVIKCVEPRSIDLSFVRCGTSRVSCHEHSLGMLITTNEIVQFFHNHLEVWNVGTLTDDDITNALSSTMPQFLSGLERYRTPCMSPKLYGCRVVDYPHGDKPVQAGCDEAGVVYVLLGTNAYQLVYDELRLVGMGVHRVSTFSDLRERTTKVKEVSESGAG